MMTHFNKISQEPYQGQNILILDKVLLERGYQSREWLTYNQAQSIGYVVKKGEKSARIIFFAKGEKKQKSDKYYSVFNIEQCKKLDTETDYENMTLESLKSELAKLESHSDYLKSTFTDAEASRPTDHEINHILYCIMKKEKENR